MSVRCICCMFVIWIVRASGFLREEQTKPHVVNNTPISDPEHVHSHIRLQFVKKNPIFPQFRSTKFDTQMPIPLHDSATKNSGLVIVARLLIFDCGEPWNTIHNNSRNTRTGAFLNGMRDHVFILVRLSDDLFTANHSQIFSRSLFDNSFTLNVWTGSVC